MTHKRIVLAFVFLLTLLPIDCPISSTLYGKSEDSFSQNPYINPFQRRDIRHEGLVALKAYSKVGGYGFWVMNKTGVYSYAPISSLDNKYLLREISKNLLPSDILKRPKTGFVPPVDTWINTIWNYKNNEQNSFKILKSLGLINKDELNNLKISGTLKYRIAVADIWFTKILEN